MSIKKRFPLPNPSKVKFTYCKLPIEGAPKTGRPERRYYDCGYCAGCNERHMYVETASVAGFPFLCKDCYRKVYQYSQQVQDPYGIKRMWEDDEVDEETTRKIIACAERLDQISQSMQNAFIYKMISNREYQDEPDTEDHQSKMERMQYGEDGQGRGNSEFITTCDWTEKKELKYYKSVLPELDERDFDFDLCDNRAFSDYLNKITITVNSAYQNDRIRAIKMFMSENPLVDVICEAVKTRDGFTQIRLVHRAESIDAAHEKFRRIVLKYRSVFPYLSDASGMVFDDQKSVIVVLRQYMVQG